MILIKQVRQIGSLPGIPNIISLGSTKLYYQQARTYNKQQGGIV
jgi:hypothetical protein